MPVTMVTMMTESGERSRSHGLSRDVLEAQASRLGLPIRLAATSWAQYDDVFRREGRRAVRTGVRFAIFGDIAGPGRHWVEESCAAVGLTPYLPLWKRNGVALHSDVRSLGFRAVVVAVRADVLPNTMLGREVDDDLVRQLAAAGVDVSGEGGEYHTVVVDGPNFGAPLDVHFGGISLRDGVWFIDVTVGG